MATIANIKQQYGGKQGVSSLFTNNQQQALATKADEEEKNQGGFWGGLGYVVEKVGLGFLSGVEGIWDYTAGGLAKLFGADDWAEQQFANDWVNYNHADEWFNPSEGWQTAGNVASGIGTSLPAALGVAAAGAIAYFSGGSLSGVSASIISGVIAGFSAAGNATKEAYRETGELGGKEFGYGALVGITEGMIEGVSGAIGAGTGAVTKNIAKSFGKEVGETAVRQTLGKTIIKGFVGEAFEEGVATLIDPVWKRITYDPDAKNATFEEVAYASLVGGLAGAIMGGVDVSVRSVRNVGSTIRGNKLLGEGRANDVIATAENISQTAIEQETTTAPIESSADTTATPTENTAEMTSETDTTAAGTETNDATPEYESFKLVKSILSELKTSMQKTNGQIVNARQKMLLGYLEQANTAAAFEPFIATSAENIYNNAEAVAERMNAYGYTDPNGKPITYTAEQLRAGIDTSSPRAFRRSMSKALRTNSALGGLAIVDATGRLTLDTSRFADATLRGQRLSSQVDLNRFIEMADENELRAVGEKLGIEKWETLTNEEFQGKITKFVQDGGVETYKNERILAREVESVDPTTAKKTLPRMVNLRADGTYRYTQGNTDIAIVKRGDSYRIYDYSSKRMSKSLTRTEVNKTLKEIHANEANYTESARQFVERQSEIVRRTAEIDAYARENIPDYTKLNAPNQSIIRSIIRQGRAAGVSEDFVLSCARISARSGLNIVFSKEMSFVAANGTHTDGAIDLKRNRIIVNPEAKNRTDEMILIHELTHAIYKLDGDVLQVAEGLETMTADEKEKIRKRYATIGQGSAIEVSDEINAHFAEQTLANKNILERLATKKPSLKQKILAFFKGAKSDYQGDAKLTGAAARLYKQYKKLFDEFAAKNQQRNAVETGTSTTSYALSDSLRTLSAYSDAEITNIERNTDFSVARSYEDVRGFIDNVEKFDRDKSLFLGKIGDKNAAKILTETGVDVKGKSLVLNSSNLRHIFNNHGNAASEALSGQIAVTKNNIESVIETLVEPDSVERSDENGKVGIMFKKNINGRVMAITILSEKKKALTLKSAWIIKNKQHISPTDNASALPSTSKTGKSMNTVYSNSISETTEKVNPKKQKTTKKFALSLESIEEKYKNQAKVLLLTENKGSVSIRNLVVEPEQRNKGVGQAILDDIVAYADAKSKIITLTPTSEYGTKKRLISWYKKNGFVENKGKNTDFTISDTMYRLPISSKKFALPAENSDGEHLSDAQRVFFAKSKVVDEQGRLLKVYHGTPNGNFTVFRTDYGGAYFTTSETYAKRYARAHTSPDARILECYLNIKKPFDTRQAAERKIFEEEFYGQWGNGAPLGESGLPDWTDGDDLIEFIADKGYDYDGLILDEGGDGGYGEAVSLRGESYVIFKPEQAKLTTNTKPTNNSDFRFALDDTDSDVRGNYTVGQRARFAANNTGMRVYSRAEAADVINSIIEERLVLEEYGMYGELKGKDREAAIDYLFTKLNTTKEGYRAGVALKIADFMIEHTVLTDMYAEESIGDAMQILSILRSYMHRIDLAQIRADVQHRFDKKNTIELVWGQKGGIAPDTLGQLLAEEGIHLDAINGADMFFQMYDMYVEARDMVNAAAKKVMLSSFGSQADIESLRQAIARDVLIAYDSRGKKSKFAKLVEKYTAEIARLKQRVRDLQAEDRLLNSIVDKAQKMKDLKLGTFLNSTQFKSDVFKQSIEKLARIKNRGNFNIAGTRKIIAELRTWYTKDNPLLADSYEQGIADMLDTIAAGTKNYTTDELKMINNVMAYFTNFVEKFNKVYRQGKWVEAIPEATRYIDVIHENETVKVGLFRKLSGSTYMQTFGDPMTVARRMDMYENGFYTEMLQELREAAIDAEVSEMEVKADYEEFMRKHKKYLSQISKEKVKYQGVEIPKTHLIGLYMTLKRSQSHAGLVFNGFSFIDTDGKKVRVQGLAPEITTDLELIQVVARETAALESMMSATDKEYIAILEKGYNTDAKKLKADRDMQRLGFTNATEGYYYPIRRGNIAKNVDTSDVQGELDRVSNSSFNKDTVRGAKQELFIESADIVYNRHIHAVCQYAALSPAIETYNRLYNLDISGNPNKPISVATESANTWAKGNKYFAKLISDIQGIPSSSSEGMRALRFIRGSYAKYQLGANPKVWITQLSSLFSASSILDADSITKGMFISAKGIDDYCSLAKLRNSDNTAAMAQGVIDKVGKFSNFFMAPIGKMDRFVVRRLFGACQVQVEKNGGAKVGTEANKVEAGKLLRKVILETQQNSMATERSAAMRSGNEIMRTLTMFTSDSMKVIGRVIDSIGELSTLRAKLKMTTDPDVQARMKNQIKAAHTKVRKSATALVLTALFMAGIAQLFRWLYNKDQDEDETVAETIIVDFVGNLFGGLPLIKDVYARLVEGYDVDNYTYSAVNDLLDSASGLFEAVKKIVSDEATSQDIASSVKSLTYSVGQMFGIPTRNLYNVFYGLTKRISPMTAYQIDNVFYKKNYTNDLNKAIENEDDEMAAMLLSLVLNERVGDEMSDSVRETLSKLYKDGYSVLPRTINGSITYNNETIELNDAELSRFKSVYTQANKYVETMVNSKGFKSLSAEQQAKAIKQLYDAYYYKAISDLLKTDANTTIGKLSKWISVDKLSVAFAALSGIESDKDDDGKTISGSRKKKIVEGLMKQNLSDGERLLILCYKGYSIQNGDYKGYTAKRAKHILLKYILSLKNTSQAEKAAIAEQCGFEVKNGRIVRESLYTTNK